MPRRLVGYLLSDLSDQNAKDFSLLQNQRSSQNIGVVVGNMLSGCYKKGVELIDQYEEQFETIPEIRNDDILERALDASGEFEQRALDARRRRSRSPKRR